MKPLLLAVVFLGIAVLVLRRTDPERVRAYVEPEDGVQPADPYLLRWFPDGSYRYEPVSA